MAKFGFGSWQVNSEAHATSHGATPYCVWKGEDQGRKNLWSRARHIVNGTVTMWRIRKFNSSYHPQKERHQSVESVLILILHQSLLVPLPWSFQDLLAEAFRVGDVGLLWKRHLLVHTAQLPCTCQEEEQGAGGRGWEMAAPPAAQVHSAPTLLWPLAQRWLCCWCYSLSC